MCRLDDGLSAAGDGMLIFLLISPWRQVKAIITALRYTIHTSTTRLFVAWPTSLWSF